MNAKPMAKGDKSLEGYGFNMPTGKFELDRKFMNKRQERGPLLTGYDLTVPAKRFELERGFELHQVIIFMEVHCSRWSVWKERSKTGDERYQCRITLTRGKRLGEMKRFLKKNLYGTHCDPISSEDFRSGKEPCVKKGYTRIGGPWTHESTPVG